MTLTNLDGSSAYTPIIFVWYIALPTCNYSSYQFSIIAHGIHPRIVFFRRFVTLFFSTVGKLGSIAIQTVRSEAIPELLKWIHCEASELELAGMGTEYRFRQQICWLPNPIEALQEDLRIAAAYFTCLPGELAMLGGVRAVAGAESLAVDLLQHQVRSIRAKMPQAHIQAATPEADISTQELVQAAGFKPLTAVDQLWTNLTEDHFTRSTPQVDLAPSLRWLPASVLSRRRFVKLIEATFDGTLDCPELNELRTNDQVVQSFLMQRPFRSCPHWFTLWKGDTVIGCLLLFAHNPELVELVYMGLVPSARGQRSGQSIIGQAKRIAAELGATLLVLAADIRNAPAIKTYTQCGFQHHRRLQVHCYP